MIFDMYLQGKGYFPYLPDVHTPGSLKYKKDSLGALNAGSLQRNLYEKG